MEKDAGCRGKKDVEITRDCDSGIDAIHQAFTANIWEWSHGSPLFFGDGLRNIVQQFEMV